MQEAYKESNLLALSNVGGTAVVVAPLPAPAPIAGFSASGTNVPAATSALKHHHSSYNPNQLPPRDVLNEWNPNFAGHSLAQDEGSHGGELRQRVPTLTNQFVFDTPRKGRESEGSYESYDAETIANLPSAERERYMAIQDQEEVDYQRREAQDDSYFGRFDQLLTMEVGSQNTRTDMSQQLLREGSEQQMKDHRKQDQRRRTRKILATPSAKKSARKNKILPNEPVSESKGSATAHLRFTEGSNDMTDGASNATFDAWNATNPIKNKILQL